MYHLVSDPVLIAEVLQSRAANYLRDTRSSRSVRLVTGESLLTSEGAGWRRQRHALQPIFHHRHLIDLARIMAEVAGEIGVLWDRAASTGATLELASEMNRLAFAVAGRCLFGADLRKRAGAVETAFPVLLDELFRRTSHLVSLPMWMPLPRHAAFKRALAAIDQVVAELIAEHRQRPPETTDLLGLLLRARNEDGGKLDDEALRNHTLTFLLAGHETTANALTWCIALLASQPDELEKVQSELDALGCGTGGAVEIIPKLDYLTAVLQETLRLYPSIWIIERRVAEADELSGWRIPKGSAVVVSPYVTQRAPERWQSPESFRPERFLSDEPRTLQQDGYFPFGAGPHTCIGQHFAMMQAKIVLATLLSRFRVILLEPAIPPPAGGITLRPSAPFPIRVQRRT